MRQIDAPRPDDHWRHLSGSSDRLDHRAAEPDVHVDLAALTGTDVEPNVGIFTHKSFDAIGGIVGQQGRCSWVLGG